MPYDVNNPPEKLRGLPESKQRQWVHVYDSCMKDKGDDVKCQKMAWGVTGGWKDEKSVDDVLLEAAASETVGMDLELKQLQFTRPGNQQFNRVHRRLPDGTFAPSNSGQVLLGKNKIGTAARAAAPKMVQQIKRPPAMAKPTAPQVVRRPPPERAVSREKPMSTGAKVATAAVATAAAAGAGYMLVRGFKIHKASNIVRYAKKNGLDIHAVVNTAVGVGDVPHTLTRHSILNTVVNDEAGILQRMFGKFRVSRFAQKMRTYIKDPNGYQKDLNEAFGHLDIDGAKHIDIKYNVNRNPKTVEEFMNNATSYDQYTNRLNVNLEEMAIVGESSGLTPKQFLLHEYAHSLTNGRDMRGFKYAEEKFLGKYIDDANALVGRTMKLRVQGALGLEFQNTYAIKSVKHVRNSLDEAIDMTNAEFSKLGISGAIKKSHIDKYNLHDASIKYFKVEIENVDNPMDRAEFPSFIFQALYGKGLGGHKNPLHYISVEGLDSREMYGLSQLTEYISVFVERGGKM